MAEEETHLLQGRAHALQRVGPIHLLLHERGLVFVYIYVNVQGLIDEIPRNPRYLHKLHLVPALADPAGGPLRFAHLLRSADGVQICGYRGVQPVDAMRRQLHAAT